MARQNFGRRQPPSSSITTTTIPNRRTYAVEHMTLSMFPSPTSNDAMTTAPSDASPTVDSNVSPGASGVSPASTCANDRPEKQSVSHDAQRKVASAPPTHLTRNLLACGGENNDKVTKQHSFFYPFSLNQLSTTQLNQKARRLSPSSCKCYCTAIYTTTYINQLGAFREIAMT